MEKNINKALNNFLEDEEQLNNIKGTNKNKSTKKIHNKDGLIERVDKKLIVEDGRQMLLD
jgi:hypothetical protein